MLELTDVHLNVRMLKDFYWKLNESPLTIVRGLNLDEGKRSTNYVGKSLIWSSIATVLTGENAYVGDKKTAKLLYSPNSRIELNVKQGKTKYDIIHSFNKNLKIEIHQNGKDITPHQKPQAAMLAQNKLGINTDVFYSQIYISSIRPSVLLYGTVAQRYDYFERIFSMQIYDAVNKIANKKLSEIRLAESQLKILKDEYALVEKAVDPTALHRKLKKNKALFAVLSKRLSKLNKIVERVTENKAILAQLNSKDLQHDEAALTAKLEKLRKKYEAAKEQNEQYIIYTENKRKIAELKEKFASDVVQVEIAPLEAELKLANEYMQAVAKYEKYLPDYEKAKKLNVPFDLDDYKVIKAKRDNLQDQLAKIQQLKEGDCIECGQPVTKSHIKKHIKQLQKNIDALDKDLPIARMQQIYRVVHPVMSKFKKTWTAKQIAKLEQDIEQGNKANAIALEQKQIKKQIAELKLSKVKKPDLNSIRDKFNSVKDKIVSYREARKLQEKLNSKYLDFNLDTIKAERDSINDRFLKLNEKQHPLMARYQEGKISYNKKLDLEKRIADIHAITSDRECYEHISKNYSPKGMRVQQIQMLVQNYIDGLNQMASLLFAKKVTFSAKVDPNNFPIFLTRNGETGDIRTLSGAEGRMFLALSAVVFSQLLPQAQRCSHLILDEIESCMSPQNVEIFSKQFIPEICKLYKHVIVVTPMLPKEMSFINANEKTIVKQNNISRWVT